MARKTGSRKLVDIRTFGEKGLPGGERLQDTLEKFLKRHKIEYQTHFFLDGFVRYYVNVRDLSAAQAVLPALKAMAEGGPDVS